MVGQGARHRADRRRAAGQPRGRRAGDREGGGPRRAGRDRQGVGPPATRSCGPGSTALDSPWGLDDLDRRRHRGRRHARRDHDPQGRGARGHPLRRPPARPARGQGRPRPADPRPRHPRDRPRRGQRRGDLRRLAAHAGPVARPGRPRRQPADEDDPRRRRPPRLPRARTIPTPADADAPAADLPAGPVALHDRPHGRRLRDATGSCRTTARSATSPTPSPARTSSATPTCSAASGRGACTRRRSTSPSGCSAPTRPTSPTPGG